MPLKIEHRIGVQAPADVIWEILSDLPAWSDWNPMYPQAAGVIRYGERLTFTEVLPGRPERTINVALADWAPDEALHWRTSSHGGLIQTIRFLEIETLGPNGCAFSNGELFMGPLGNFVARRLKPTLRPAFTALGEAMRDRAEARWRDRSGDPK